MTRRSNDPMRLLTRLVLAAVLLIAAARAGAFLAVSYLRIGSPVEVFHLESKMVHLAWRVQHGIDLYPEWRAGPHVVNVFSPIYFVTVGMIGRFLGSSLDGLYPVGRVVTSACVLVSALLVGGMAGRRLGRAPGALAFCLALGGAPLVGFGFMVRSDAMADLLGFAGALLALRSGWRSVAAGGVLLVLAVLTKQTTGMYLIASCAGLMLMGRWRAAVLLGVGAGLGLALVVAATTLLIEPDFAVSLVEVGGMPFDPGAGPLTRLARLGPEVLVLPMVGIALWSVPSRRRLDLVALAVVVLVLSSVTSLKRGADLNYFLGLRLVAALAGAEVVSWCLAAPSRWWRALAAVLMAAVLVPGLLLGLEQLSAARAESRFFASSSGRAAIAFARDLGRMAADPSRHLLTDSGLIDIRQGARAEFGDPWLLRMLADANQIDTSRLEGLVNARHYELIATTHDLFAPTYETYDFGLPVAVMRRARVAYGPSGRMGGFYFYTPRAVTQGAAP
jgi:hypothetical protein